MRKSKTTWLYSLENEAKLILHCAHQVVTGFYRVNNFLVLPMGSSGPFGKTVFFPDLPYHKIRRFWEISKKTDINTLPVIADKEIISAITELIIKAKFKNPDYLKIKSKWSAAESQVLTEIEKIIPDKRISKITIFPTIFGTSASFNVAKTNPSEIQIYLREDQGIYSVAEAILSAITRQEVFDELGGLWGESEMLADWLVTKSSIAEVLKKFEPRTSFTPTIFITRSKQSAKLLKLSDEFYRKLGISFCQDIFKLQKNTVLINKIKPDNFSPIELEILKLLITNQNRVVSFDRLGDMMFSDEDKFSLWSIAKKIQRIRDKLEDNGISGSFIQTLRGQGYLLKN